VGQPDQELLANLKLDNQKAIKEIYRSNYSAVEAMILKNSGTKDDAKDVFQDAMIVLYKNVRKIDFELTSSIKTYLYSVSWRMWMQRIKKVKKMDQVLLSYDEQVEPVEFDFPLEKPDNQLQSVIEILEKVGKNCLEILKRYYFNKEDFEVIAESLGYASGQVVREQKYRCIKRVREKMKAR
jgi:RNA polymerase sigma factor (sigma-70 family)